MNIIIFALVLLLTGLTLIFSVKIYLNIVKYQEAALGLIFSNLKDSIFYFKLYAVSISILAISRCLDVINISQIQYVADFATAMVLLTDLLLVIVFYKISIITDIGKNTEG
jgi:hypothetical protein